MVEDIQAWRERRNQEIRKENEVSADRGAFWLLIAVVGVTLFITVVVVGSTYSINYGRAYCDSIGARYFAVRDADFCAMPDGTVKIADMDKGRKLLKGELK